MIYIKTLEEISEVKNFAILMYNGVKKIVIKKYEEPIVVDIDTLDSFMLNFNIKEELILWICSNIDELKEDMETFKELLIKLCNLNDTKIYSLFDGSGKYEIKSPKHNIEVLYDQFGSEVQIKDKKNRMLTKASVYDKKSIATTFRHDNDMTDIVVLYPKTKEKKIYNLHDLKKDGESNEKTQ